MRLFDRQGFHGTGLAQVIADSGAPRGSFYFHFPGGKEQLAHEAIAVARDEVIAVMDAAGRDDPAAILRGTAAALAAWLERSAFAEGCAVASITLDVAADREHLRIDCRDAFRAWHEHLAEALRAAGTPGADAADQAWTCVAALEGAVVLSRAERSAEPVRAVGRTLERVVRGRP